MTDRIHLRTVDLTSWDPSDELFDKLLNTLPNEAIQRIRKYRFKQDAQCNLIGRLLPLWNLCSSDTYKWHELTQAKEAKGRPYLASATTKERIKNYDSNTSDDNGMVLVASVYEGNSDPSPPRLGADVMQLSLPQGIQNIGELQETVNEILSSNERIKLLQTPEQDKLNLLLRHWAAKEAISKAIGDGLSYPLAEIDLSSFDLQAEQQYSVTAGGRICTIRLWTIDGQKEQDKPIKRFLCVLAALGPEEVDMREVQVESVEVNVLVEACLAFAAAEEAKTTTT